jgi:hypothetical protein
VCLQQFLLAPINGSHFARESDPGDQLIPALCTCIELGSVEPLQAVGGRHNALLVRHALPSGQPGLVAGVVAHRALITGSAASLVGAAGWGGHDAAGGAACVAGGVAVQVLVRQVSLPHCAGCREAGLVAVPVGLRLCRGQGCSVGGGWLAACSGGDG